MKKKLGVVKGVAFVAVKLTQNNEFPGNKNLEKSGYGWRSYQDGPLDMVDAFIIFLKLVYRDLIAGEQLNLFAIM